MKLDTKEYRREFELWLINSTMDGFPNLARAKWHLTHFIFWLLLFLASLGLCIYMVTKSILDYYQFDVVTTDRLTVPSQINFPVVTFCNQNLFLNPNATKYIKNYMLTNYGFNVSSYQDLIKVFGGPLNADSEISWMIYQTSNLNFQDSTRRSFGYSAEDMFFKLEFNGELVNISRDLEWYYDVNFGNCYRFNSKSGQADSYNVSRTDNRLYAELFTGLPYAYNQYLYEPNLRGLILEINDPTKYPYLIKPLNIQAGKMTSIALNKVKSKILPKPYSDCNSVSSFSTPVFDEMKRLEIDYDLAICAIGVLQYKTVSSLNCYDQQLVPFFTDYPPCSSRKLFNAIPNVSVQVEDLWNMCPMDCNTVLYKYTLGYEQFPSSKWHQSAVYYQSDYIRRIFGERTPDIDTVKSSFAAVSIYFDPLLIEQINEKPATELVSLLSNIGGLMGLFIGPSVLTFTEIFELVFAFTSIWLAKRRMANETTEKLPEKIDAEKSNDAVLNKITFIDIY